MQVRCNLDDLGGLRRQGLGRPRLTLLGCRSLGRCPCDQGGLRGAFNQLGTLLDPIVVRLHVGFDHPLLNRTQQIGTPHSVLPSRLKLQSVGVPPNHLVGSVPVLSPRRPRIKAVNAGTYVVLSNRQAARPLDHAVLPEPPKPPRVLRLAPPAGGWVEGRIQRGYPPVGGAVPVPRPRVVADSRDDQQVACSGRGYVGHPHALGSGAGHLFLLVFQQLGGLPASST